MSDIGKFIFFSVLVFFTVLHVHGGFKQAKSEELPANAAVVYEAVDPAIYSKDPGIGGEKSGVLKGTSISPVPAPIDHNLVFFRLKASPMPELKAREVMVGEIRGGETYYAADAKNQWPLASLTKLMAAVIAVDRLKPTSTISIQASDLKEPDVRFAASMVPGMQYTTEDLIRVLLVGSSNEAAEALARAVGREEFVKAMNDKAREWGLRETYFKDPAGVSAANQSSAADIFSLVFHIQKSYPDILKKTGAAKTVITEIGAKKKFTVQSTHQLSGRSDFLGGKTGTTPEAGENLLTIISYGGRPVVIIVLGDDDRYNDTVKLIDWFKNDFSPGY